MKTNANKKNRKRARRRHIIFLFLFLGIFAIVHFFMQKLQSQDFLENKDCVINSPIFCNMQKEAEEKNINQGIEGRKIPVILQNPQLPSGCEAVSAVMLLSAYGFSVDKEEFANALPWCKLEQHNGETYACHPSEAFVGSPYSEGYGVFSNVIVKTMQEFIDKNGGMFLAKNITGASEEDILNYLNQGTPVCIWISMDLKEIRYKNGWYLKDGNSYTDKYFKWPGGEHCVVLTDYEKNTVLVHDPLKGKTEYNRQTFFKRYKEMGSQAVIITND